MIYASLMSIGFIIYLFINDFVPNVCNLMLFYDGVNAVMSVLSTTKHS